MQRLLELHFKNHNINPTECMPDKDNIENTFKHIKELGSKSGH